ncbi:LamG domain-containing protein [Streptomyces sp. NPDC000618]|uniref:LamG domain-containing protein n=1 Tax=Streptomyces sp. NPDC000618 TaxID=3154265 RepID=UPI0033224222
MSADTQRPIRRGVLLRAAVAAAVTGAVTAGTLAVLPGGAPAGPAPVAADQPTVTEQQAMAVAKESGKKTEVVGLRTERREIFAEPDGTFTAREYTDPVRTVQGGKWVKVDATLVKRSDGSWGPKAATVDLAFSAGQAGKPFVTMQRAGREFALTWPYGKLPAPRVEGETATYVDALPGVDLTVRAEVDGFGHLLVVKTPEAAADPRLAQLDLGMATDGLKVTEDATGAILAEDSVVGGTVFQAGKPSMWDSAAVQEAASRKQGPKAVAKALKAASAGAAAADDTTAATPTATPTAATATPGPQATPEAALEGPGGGGRVAPLGVEVGKGKLRLVPDQKLLKGAGTVFPVVIDPIQRTTSRTSWTGVMSGMPTEQDWKYSGSAGVGKCPTDYNPVSCNGVGTRRVMFTMPLSFYKGKQILGATFSARVEHIYSATPTAEPIRLYRIGGQNYTLNSSSNWSNTSDDWDDHIGTVDKAISPTSCSSQANLHFESNLKTNPELTSEVQAAATGGWNSMTLGLRATDESRFAEWKRICGNAYLSVSYNNLPRQIKTSDMSTDPGGVCKWGTSRPYVDSLPKLRAIASDPDHGNGQTDKVKVEFKIEWGGTTPGSYTYITKDALSPTTNTKFEHTVKSVIPQNTVIYWSARANDGDGNGPWSSDGDPAQRCEFIYDKTWPGKPNVLSKQYPSDTVYHDGVGTYGTFTFSPNPNDSIPDTDVVKYQYSFDGAALTTLTPTAGGGSVSAQWVPTRAGRHVLEVIAIDKATHASSNSYDFLVAEGRPVVGQWNLADEAGGEAHDESGEYSATAGSAVTFGADGPGGKADKAAHFDGTGESYLDTNETVLDSAKSFSVSAWVRPTALDKNMTVISQDGTGEPGFTLGYDATAQTWKFSVPVNDVDSLGEWKAVSTGISVVKDQWVLLTGVYDAQKTGGPVLQLYINKDLKASAARRSTWKSYGPLQIGRSTAKSGYRDNFTGDLAEVRVFDRVVLATEVSELMTVKPARKGYWQLDDASSGASVETGGGQALTLAGNASIYRPLDPLFDTAALVGDGNLVLDGDGDYASTATAPVTGNSSFTVTARAQLTSLDPEKSQTVLSLPGANANRVQVRYQATTGQWELAVAKSDVAAPAVVTFTDDQELPDTGGSGQHLAVVYDAFANSIRLYVEGQLVAGAYGTENSLWSATGGLQVGRSLRGASEYFAGAIDEVRVYSGAADQIAVQQMAALTAVSDM